MILEFDLGNSRCKWRLVEPGGASVAVGCSAVLPVTPFSWLSALPQAPRRVRGGSVAAEAINAALVESITARWGVSVEFARSTAECAGVRNGYHQPERLGVDRWLAIVAAYQACRRPVVVIDAGSALTIDLVNAAGQHLGGYIIPGRQMLLDVLHSATAGVRFEQTSEAEALIRCGRNTGEAVVGGARLALNGAVHLALEEADQCLGDYDLVLTGGDSKWLQSVQERAGPARVVWDDDLVLDGLQWVVP